MGDRAMSNKTLRIYLAAAIIAAVVGFYVYSHWKQGSNPFSGIRGRNFNTSHFDVPFTRFKGVETLRNASLAKLVAEVKEVIRQNGLPADVFVDDGSQINNIAVMLHDFFHEFYVLETPNDSLERLWDASPIGEWDVSEQTLENVRVTLNRFESKRQAIRNMLLERNTRFYYIFVYPESLGSRYDVGITINTEASRYLADYALLEEYAIAQALLDGNIGEAMAGLAYIFRITYLASHLRNVGTRSDAASVRRRAFDVMQRVILDPKFDRTHMIYLRTMLSEEHKNWIPEHNTWFGDRASGIIMYHRVLLYGMDDEGMDDVFEEAELNELDRRVSRHMFRQGFATYREADQAFYLRSMQKILDISEEPFAKRLNVLNQIYGELFEREDIRDDKGIAMEPFVANILLKDIDRLMEHFARDESALNRALVLILASLGQSNTDRYRDPFTDEPYEIQEVDGFLSITTPNLPRPFRVPIFVERE